MRMAWVFGVVAASMVSISSHAQVPQTIAYGQAPDQALDLYAPEAARPAPLVVFIHGGGWVTGDKSVGHFIAGPLITAGYAVASIGYRKIPLVAAQGEVEDAAQAIAYLLKNAAALHLNPNGIAVMGHSSGGHVAALLGTDQRYLQNAGADPHRIAAIVTLDGVYDVAANVTEYPSATRREVFGEDASLWHRLSPTMTLNLMVAHPAFCVMNNNTDPRFIEQAALFIQALRAHGEKWRSAVAPGMHHVQMVHDFGVPGRPMLPFVLDCLRAFLPAP